MQQYGLIHPRMLDTLQPNFYPSLCTLYAPNATIASTGEEVYNPTPIVGLEDLPCRIAPKSNREARQPQQNYVEATHHIALNGYYPAIATNMFASVDGHFYAIEGAIEDDGNDQTQRLYVREVFP